MNKDLTMKLVVLAASTMLSGCASLDFLSMDSIKRQFTPQQTLQDTKVAMAWQATLPHGGQLENLENFWSQYHDALLLELIEAAQKESATIASATARIAEAREKRISTNSNTIPIIDGTASSSRSKQGGGNFGNQLNSIGQSGALFNNSSMALQASWELDILGANKVLVAAAERREKASQSAWHDARVSVAAEVATAYFNQRFCSMQYELNLADAKSKIETARLTEISYKAGFAASGALRLAQASAADASQQLKAQQASCEIGIKELVALTNWDESELRQKLVQSPFKLDSANDMFAINEVPANVIMQRPDIDSAEADLVSAAADIKSTQAARLPRVTLGGSIGWQRISSSDFSNQGETWSLGPISITLPIFDGGKRKATLEANEVKYEEMAANYRSKVRTAVKEVETALVTLHSTQSRAPDVASSIQAYQEALVATEHKYKAGFANLIELEESRRYALQAQINQVNLLQARNNAWISLYRAVGGGWQSPTVTHSLNMNQENQS